MQNPHVEGLLPNHACLLLDRLTPRCGKGQEKDACHPQAADQPLHHHTPIHYQHGSPFRKRHFHDPLHGNHGPQKGENLDGGVDGLNDSSLPVQIKVDEGTA